MSNEYTSRLEVDEQIEELIDRLPYDSWLERNLSREGEGWRFSFKGNSQSRKFWASGFGMTPMEAFLFAKQNLIKQITNWHATRFKDSPQARAEKEFMSEPEPGISEKSKRILIVDDDLEIALAMQKALDQLGCRTDVAVTHEEVAKKMVYDDFDLIFMDWTLNNQTTAGQVVEKALDLIYSFSDLRTKLRQRKPKVVTCSVLSKDQVFLPKASSEFFSYHDHWQKPMNFTEIINRAASLLKTPEQWPQES